MPEGSPHSVSTGRARRLGVGLLVATAALIVYASLFPFRFEASERSLASLVGELAFERPTRGDFVANVLLYAPLGFCIALVLARPRRAFAAVAALDALAVLAAAAAGGLALSFCMEVLQSASAARVASLTDVVANGVGAAAGAAAGLAFVAGAVLPRFRALAAARAAPAAVVVTILWLAAGLAPFVPTIDWQKYKDALKPVLVTPTFGTLAALDALALAVGWVVIAHALRELWPRFALRAWLGAAACWLAGQVVVVERSVSPAEVAALVAALPVAALLGRVGVRKAAAALAAATAAVVVLRGLEPFAFAAEPQRFGWMPFAASITGGLEVSFRVILEKAFWYFALVWLLASAGLRLAPAAVSSAALVAVIEAAQIWLPPRTPEITDPLIVLLLAWLLHSFVGPARAP